MTDFKGFALLREARQVLADQVSNECPTCDAEGTWTDEADESKRRLVPLKHKPDCLIRRIDEYFGEEP